MAQCYTNPKDIHDFITQGMKHSNEIDFEKWLLHYDISISFKDCRKKSLYEVVEIIISSVLKIKTNTAYIQYFLDIILERDVRNTSGIADFLAYWDTNSEKFKIPSPEGSDAIQIMTIHKSKGLEFPVVIFPFAEENFSKQKKDKLWVDFEQENFDWRLTLEGSQNQREWFTITENYRITSIKNELTDFQFTTVSFPSSSYRFFRIRIDSKEKPDLTVAHLTQSEKTEGVFRNYPIKIQEFGENKKEKQTEIKLELQVPVAVSHLKINISDKVDYYRPITIMYLSDSVKTEKGWKYSYSKLTSGTLNSMEENEFKFKCTTLKNLKIIIYNQDNQALSIDSIQVKGYIHEIVARFTEPANYFLTYGNEKAVKASYDIERFTDKIPDTLKALDLGIEQKIGKEKIGMFGITKKKLPKPVKNLKTMSQAIQSAKEAIEEADVENAIKVFDQFIDPTKSGEQMIENFFEEHREIRLWKIRLKDRGADYMIENKDKMLEVLENIEVTITKKLRDEIA